MIVFRIILLVALAISFIGGIAGNQAEKRDCRWLFGCSGMLFLLSFAVERLI